MSDEKRRLAAALGGEVVGTRQADGSWLCACGESLPDDLSLYSHRRSHAVPSVSDEGEPE